MWWNITAIYIITTAIIRILSRDLEPFLAIGSGFGITSTFPYFVNFCIIPWQRLAVNFIIRSYIQIFLVQRTPNTGRRIRGSSTGQWTVATSHSITSPANTVHSCRMSVGEMGTNSKVRQSSGSTKCLLDRCFKVFLVFLRDKTASEPFTL